MPAANVTISAEFIDVSSGYIFDELTGTIGEYVGSDSNIIIPSQIKGVPVKYIGQGAFADCSSLTGVTIPEGVIGIKGGAFYSCQNLKGVTLPETLTAIGIEAFSECNLLINIRIPNGVNEIGDYAFKYCNSLRTAYFEGNAPENFGINLFNYTATDFKILYNTNSEKSFIDLKLSYKILGIQSVDVTTAVEADLGELDIVYDLSIDRNIIGADEAKATISEAKAAVAIGSKAIIINEDKDSVKNNLYLPLVGAIYGSGITWQSDNESVISNNGLVTRPDFSSGDAHVKLTATVTNNGSSATKEFDIVVLKQNQSNTTDTVISIAALAGVTAPVKGATPVVTIADTSEYTASISWSPTATTFAASTAYTATITITPKTGYTLTGVPANFFTVAGATATNAIGSGVVTAVFPATADLIIPTSGT